MLLANLFASAQIEMKKVNVDETIERLFQLKKETIPTIACNVTDEELNSFCNEKKDNRGVSPFAVGKVIDVSYSLADGIWTDVKGGRIWRLSFSSEDAKFISFYFNHIILPDGAWLYTTNQKEDVLFGPVVSTNIFKGTLHTPKMKGSLSTIYLFEPKENKGKSSLNISKVIHGFINDEEKRSRNEFSYISNDVACYPEYMDMSNAVCTIYHSCRDTSYNSTGALLMTNDDSFKLYCLTAFHTIDVDKSRYLDNQEIAAIESAMFSFGYKNRTCNGSLDTGRLYMGATLKAYRRESDFALLEVCGGTTGLYDLYWLGWNNIGNVPLKTFCLHNPHGGAMKIAFDDDSPATGSFIYDTNNCWVTEWEEGYTEEGSSGGPLLDENNNVVGQLWGIPNDSITSNNSIFGKINLSWSAGSDSTKRLKEWLDPQGTNATIKNGRRYMAISGPMTICNSATYEIEHLANDMNVQWELSDSYYSSSNILFKTDYPSNGKCYIKRDKYHTLNGTLTAHVYWYGHQPQSFTHFVRTVPDFDCTIAAPGAPNSYTFPAYLTSGMRVNVPCNCIVTLTSSDFTHMSITKTGNASNYFEVDGSQIHFTIPTTNLGQSITIYGQSQTDCQSFSLTFLASNTPGSWKPKDLDPIDPIDFDSLDMIVYPIDDDFLQIELVENGSENRIESTTLTKNVDGDYTWLLEIYKVSNGNKVYAREVEGATFQLNTFGWESGTYVIRAIVRIKEQTSSGNPKIITTKVRL